MEDNAPQIEAAKSPSGWGLRRVSLSHSTKASGGASCAQARNTLCRILKAIELRSFLHLCVDVLSSNILVVWLCCLNRICYLAAAAAVTTTTASTYVVVAGRVLSRLMICLLWRSSIVQ